MEQLSPRPLCWVRHQVSPLRQARVRSGHSTTLRSGIADTTIADTTIKKKEIMFNRHILVTLECGQENEVICHPMLMKLQ
jgi:hypothetical protein